MEKYKEEKEKKRRRQKRKKKEEGDETRIPNVNVIVNFNYDFDETYSYLREGLRVFLTVRGTISWTGIHSDLCIKKLSRYSLFSAPASLTSIPSWIGP